MKKEKNRVGRPKLADAKLKKESIIISSICLIMALFLMIGGMVTLNIVDFSRLKGNAIDASNNTCSISTVSDSYIRLTGNIYQDYGDNGVATMTFTSSDKTLSKKINVKTKSNTPFDIAIPKGNYTLTITKDDYKTYETSISETKNMTIALTYDPTKRTYTTDDEVCLGDQCFNVMSDDGNELKLMAKYNLLVGNKVANYEYIEGVGDNFTLNPIDTSTPGYGLQRSDAKAALGVYNEETENFDYTFPWIGTIEFAKPDANKKRYSSCTGYGCYYGYWENITSEDSYGNKYSELNSDYGSDYPVWVFDSNSSLWEPIQNYKAYLQGLGYKNIEVTLPSYEDMIGLGCDRDEWSCTNAPEWTYTTSYWLGSAYDNSYVWYVVSNGDFGDDGFDDDGSLGVRPVITISKSDL